MACHEPDEDSVQLEVHEEAAGVLEEPPAIGRPQAAEAEVAAAKNPRGEAPTPEELQALRDDALVVVGRGPAAERVAARRVAAGGRLFVVATDRAPDAQAEWPEGQAPPLLWRPPVRQARPLPRFAAALRALPQQNGMKRGPDVVELGGQERLEVISCAGQLVAVRVTSEGRTVWEVSGAIVLHPSMPEAEAAPVEVLDQEAKPLCSVRPLDVLLGILINTAANFVGQLVGTAFERTAGAGEIAWWRMVMWAPNCFILNLCLASPVWGLAFTGFEPPVWFSVATAFAGVVVCALLVVAGTSNWIISPLSSLASIVAAQIWYVRTRPWAPERSWLAHFQFGNNHVNTSLGACYAYFAVAQGYMGIISAGHPGVASFFLPSMTSLVEAGVIVAIRCVYNAQVVKQRGKRPGSVVGDIRPIITVVICLAHGWGEGVRMASLVAATVFDKDDYTWVISLLLGVGMNLATRTGWAAWSLRSLLQLLGKDANSGGCLSAVYWDIRIFFGYPRFAAIVVLFLVRWIVYQDLDPSSPSFPLFNATSLLAAGLTLLTELAEDAICHFDLIPTPPCLKAHAAAYAQIPRRSLNQFFVPTAGTENDSCCVACHPGEYMGGMKPHPAMSVHGTRFLTRRMTIGLVACIPSVTLFLIELIVGTGYVRGICAFPISDTAKGIVQGFFVETPYACI